MVLKAKEGAKKPEMSVQKAQSLETYWLLQVWEQLVTCGGTLFANGRTTMV